MDALSVPNGQVANPFNITDTDWHNGIWNAMLRVLGQQDETDDDADRRCRMPTTSLRLIDTRGLEDQLHRPSFHWKDVTIG